MALIIIELKKIVNGIYKLNIFLKSLRVIVMGNIIVQTFDPYNLCFPIGAARYGKDNSIEATRFLGTGVLLNRESKTILTCAHLTDYLKEGESLCVSTRKGNYPLINIRRHSAIDLMIGTFEDDDIINSSLINLIDVIRNKPISELYLGLEVRIYGYASELPNSSKPELKIEMRKGVVTFSTSDNESVKKLGGNSRRELSFAVPNGFSGAPLLLSQTSPDNSITPVGIFYNHVESQICKWKQIHTDDNGAKYKEEGLRIEEHALVHTLDDIEFALEELNES